MRRKDFALLVIIVTILTGFPPLDSSSQGNGNVPATPVAKPAISTTTVENERKLLEKDLIIDSLFKNMDAVPAALKKATFEMEAGAKLLDRSDRRLTRSINALQPRPSRYTRLEILTPVGYSIPESKPADLPEITYEKRDERFFRKIFNWFR